MKLTKSGIVIDHKNVLGWQMVRVCSGIETFWVSVGTHKTAPRTGCPVVVFFNTNNQSWQLADYA